MEQKNILVTGATSGFGEAIAIEFARNGHNIAITGRRADRLENLQSKLETNFETNVVTLAFDVRERDQVANAVNELSNSWNHVDVLINNAGLASGLDHIDEGDPDDWDKMMDTNVKGLLYMTKAALPLVKQSQRGHIINIGSTAGKEVYERGNVYCASKHAVDALTKGMRIDLLKDGIKVTGLCPGAAETEFALVRFKGDAQRAKDIYNGYQPMSADDIAMLTHFVTTLPDHLCINDLVVTSVAQANSFYTVKD